MSWKAFIKNKETVTVNVYRGTTWEDVPGGNPVQVPANVFSPLGVFIHLTSSELVARSQFQDDSKYKIFLESTTENKTIKNTDTIKINDIEYKINGDPKKSPMKAGSWMTVYISED